MPPLPEITATGGGWALFGLFAVTILWAWLRGDVISGRTHREQIALVQKRAELAEARADKAEAQRDELLLPLARIAESTFRALPGGGGDDVPPSRG